MPLNPRITEWNDQLVWLVGASSGIGRATATLLHERGAKVVVSARQAAPLQAFEAEHPGSMGIALDATDPEALHAAAQHILARHGRIDLVVYCAGHYQSMRAHGFNLGVAIEHQHINFVGALNLLSTVLPILIRQKRGHLSVVSSVAGYRGLPNALAYGPTKAALINLAQTLYLDLRPLGVGCSVINPGFVETPLTAQNTFPMPALITPQEAAREILKGWSSGAFEIHFPRRFTWWLKLLRHLPDRLYFMIIQHGIKL